MSDSLISLLGWMDGDVFHTCKKYSMGKYDGEGVKLSSGQVGCEIPERYPDSNIYEVVDCESKAGFGKFFFKEPYSNYFRHCRS